MPMNSRKDRTRHGNSASDYPLPAASGPHRHLYPNFPQRRWSKMPHRKQDNRSTLLAGLLGIIIAAGLAAPATDAQDASTPPGPPKAVAVEEPYSVPDIGVTVLLPANTTAEAQFIPGGRTKAVLRDPSNAWVIQIFNAVSSNTTLTIAEILDNFEQQRRDGLRAYQDANPGMFRDADPRFFTDDERGRSPLVVSGRLDPPNLQIAGLPAGRFYCDTPLIDPNIVTGYTVFKQGPGRFVIFQLDCVTGTFADSRQVYETIVASATFENSDEANAERATALLVGKSFLSSISNEDIEAVLFDEPVFQRLYRPAPTGLPADATEIGWQRLQVRLGQRGELEAGKPRDRWTAADREFGYLVKIDGQINQGSDEFETQAAYFLDRERRNEAISILNRRRVDGQVVWTGSTTVIRRGTMMTLSTTQTAQPVETRDWSVPEEYISRVELELLPRLVALKTPEESTAEFDFGFFHFNINNQRLQLRRDKFTNANLVAGWQRVTQPGPQLPDVTETLDASGDLIRRELPGGVLVETVDGETLRQLQQKR
jgi:hypothetical protein